MKNEEILIIIIAVLAAFVFFRGFWFMPMMDYGQWGAYWTFGYGWVGIFMILIQILFVVALILGIIWLAKKIRER